MLELITDPAAVADTDQVAPTLVATLPSGTGELAVDAGVELIFSEPIDLDRARAGGLRLETAAGQPVASVIESHGAAVVIRPVAPLAYSTSYRVALGDVADVAGNPLAVAPAMSFSTPPLVTPATPLAVASVHPGVPCALTAATAASPGRCSSGAGGDDRYHAFALAANEPVRVTFTQAPLPASVTHGTACNAGSARIEEIDGSGACVAAVAGTFVHHDRVIAFSPDAPWLAGTRYRLTLVSGGNRSCDAGELCGISGAASFDPLGGATGGAGGGPDLVIDFTGAPAVSASLRGPMRFLPDGRIAIAVSNVADLPITVGINAPLGLSGSVKLVVPRGEMKLQLLSPPLRGGLP